MKHWEEHEGFVNEYLGISGTPASGSQWHAEGDGVDNRHPDEAVFPLIVDCKLTEKKSFSLKAQVLEQWHQKAMLLGKRFAMPIRFWKPGSRVYADYILVGLPDFKEVLDAARQHWAHERGQS
ncbi:hypothetical protein SEA_PHRAPPUCCINO_123 [Mycobacterium phage Phrappuccino]|uniref:Holliday junction resolvase n=1 Tax=Mycobacterium phage Phrappuccino TaxID=2591223 RepID=A0A514DDX1_9CAUD|nr:Holliday junction resolvase [Mycobacterium phage Phrappuccino]QDH91798.1 hypothetical protein SEA_PHRAPPUCCINO_123 [Mycobacterium phage Phrappuccino]QIQ63240.1 hypothetical protein SEA_SETTECANDELA_123 [Mycobacterium phage Settecandela]